MIQITFQVLESEPRKMFVTATMTVLCTVSVAFYVRFLVALCTDCKPRSVGY